MAKIPDSPESIFEEFTQDVQSVYNSDLTSIVLYGSGAKGEYIPQKSDINFLIVLSQKGIENLPSSAKVYREVRALPDDANRRFLFQDHLEHLPRKPVCKHFSYQEIQSEKCLTQKQCTL